MNVAVMFSGGKDSVFSTFWALMQGFSVDLLTVMPEKDSMMFHHPNIEWTKLQAKAMGLKQTILSASDAEWESKVLNVLKDYDAVISGAVASEYQRRRIDKIAEKLSIPSYAPMWHKSEDLLKEILNNFEVLLISVSAEGLTKEHLGKPLFLNQKQGIHPYLEGGEGETFVTNAPIFKKKIIIEELEVHWEGIRGWAEIKKARLF